MLCVMALERNGVRPGDGPVLVTGATGGVGSIALLLLSRLGHQVVAVTGKASEAPYLRSLGATGDPDRAELSGQGKPLQKERWSAVVDVVGSHTLANALAQTRYGGIGRGLRLAQGADLPATVMPFILRGVALVGVDSVMAPLEIRNQAWQRLAKDLDLAMLETLTREIALARPSRPRMSWMDGKVRGRILVGTGNA